MSYTKNLTPLWGLLKFGIFLDGINQSATTISLPQRDGIKKLKVAHDYLL